ERVAAAGLDGNKLLVCVLVIEQIAGHKAALFGKALAGLNGGLRGGSFLRHGGIAVGRALAAVRIGIRRDTKAASKNAGAERRRHHPTAFHLQFSSFPPSSDFSTLCPALTPSRSRWTTRGSS